MRYPTLLVRSRIRSSWPLATGSIWSHGVGCAATIRCARRSTTCWPQGAAMPTLCGHSRRTTTDSTWGTGSRWTRFATTASGISLFRTSPGPPTVQSSSAGRKKTAFHRLVDDDAEVSIDTGLRAAEKLQSLLDRRDQGDEIAELRLQVYRIQDAVKAVVPQKMWGAIVEKLDQPQHPEATDAETEDFDDDDDGYDPNEFTEEDDEA